MRRLEHVGDPDITDHRKNGPFRHVMTAEIGQEIVPGQRPQRLLLSDPPAPDAMRVERLAEHHLEGESAGRIHLAAPFLQHRLHLPLQLVGVEQRVHQRVRFYFESLAEVLGGQDHVVIGRVVVGAGVQLAAERLDLGGDLIGARPVGGPLEEHVLDDVRDPDLAILLVEVAGAHPEVDGHDGRGVILSHEHGQSVRQDFLDDLDSWRHPFTSRSSEPGAQPAPIALPPLSSTYVPARRDAHRRVQGDFPGRTGAGVPAGAGEPAGEVPTGAGRPGRGDGPAAGDGPPAGGTPPAGISCPARAGGTGE